MVRFVVSLEDLEEWEDNIPCQYPQELKDSSADSKENQGSNGSEQPDSEDCFGDDDEFVDLLFSELETLEGSDDEFVDASDSFNSTETSYFHLPFGNIDFLEAQVTPLFVAESLFASTNRLCCYLETPLIVLCNTFACFHPSLFKPPLVWSVLNPLEQVLSCEHKWRIMKRVPPGCFSFSPWRKTSATAARHGVMKKKEHCIASAKYRIETLEPLVRTTAILPWSACNQSDILSFKTLCLPDTFNGLQQMAESLVGPRKSGKVPKKKIPIVRFSSCVTGSKKLPIRQKEKVVYWNMERLTKQWGEESDPSECSQGQTGSQQAASKRQRPGLSGSA